MHNLADEADEGRVMDLVKRGAYDAAVGYLQGMQNKRERTRIAALALVVAAGIESEKRYGQIRVICDRTEFEKIKRGEGDVPPHSAIYRGECNMAEPTEEMIDLLGPENPLKVYVSKLAESLSAERDN